MRTAICLSIGWIVGGLLLVIYLKDHSIPFWLPPAAGFVVSFIGMYVLKRS